MRYLYYFLAKTAEQITFTEKHTHCFTQTKQRCLAVAVSYFSSTNGKRWPLPAAGGSLTRHKFLIQPHRSLPSLRQTWLKDVGLREVVEVGRVVYALDFDGDGRRPFPVGEDAKGRNIHGLTKTRTLTESGYLHKGPCSGAILESGAREATERSSLFFSFFSPEFSPL